MKILLTGAAGQLGSELIPLLAAHGQLVASDRVTPASAGEHWVELDISDSNKTEVLLNCFGPDLIVNAAAFTAVDAAENVPETAFEINAVLPGRLARWAKQNDARLMHYSTDYVFNGKSAEPYCETDKPDPQSVYGDSKLAGERALEASGCKYVVLRTSWVYSSHGKNFVLSMLALARKGLALKVVDDQQGCPTWARNLALTSNKVIGAWQHAGPENHYGLFHYCDDRRQNWYEFASTIFNLATQSGLLAEEPDLNPIPSSGFPQPARRPGWSVLNTDRIDTTFGIKPASFERSLQTVIDEIVNKEKI